jgi:hypothetical protein
VLLNAILSHIVVDIATFMAKLKLALKIRAGKISTRIYMLAIFFICAARSGGLPRPS